MYSKYCLCTLEYITCTINGFCLHCTVHITISVYKSIKHYHQHPTILFLKEQFKSLVTIFCKYNIDSQTAAFASVTTWWLGLTDEQVEGVWRWLGTDTVATFTGTLFHLYGISPLGISPYSISLERYFTGTVFHRNGISTKLLNCGHTY